MQERVESREGKSMKRRRMATVEPVFGSLLNYYGMKRANAKGKQAAHKMMLIAAMAYNLQKLLLFVNHPKFKIGIYTLEQANISYFVIYHVVQHPVPFSITFNMSHFIGRRLLRPMPQKQIEELSVPFAQNPNY
ncbi:transposase [Rhodocytophaga aerolata]|uniref:Transposase n=2 Tax=Rhodocytophaga aerolata TaxID=455078 RepID=A0ABT8RHW0_9BACT|nr:transposase [Rhodocytophaga aerolata]MDO1451665.1 transposase [Rhodocytophaga aerolata]